MSERIEQQLNLFACVNGSFKIEKPIRVIELFSGIGATAKSLDVLKVPYTHWKTCEWAYNSICAYNHIHIKDYTDYAKDMSKEELLKYLNGNISTDYNEPADLTKKSLSWLKDCYNNVIATHNLMNICNVKGKDLEINDLNYHYLISWSYPCQDLSLAGTLGGMKENSGTRSSLCFEVLRLLRELTPEQRKATTLIMENVPNAIGTKNVLDFQMVEKALRDMGYNNHIKILNAKEYGIPQNRERVFMISCFGDYEFPAKLGLKYKLKDFLEKDVDEKYFLSEKMIDFICSETPKHTGSLGPAMINKKTASTITTREGRVRACESNYIAPTLAGGEEIDLKKVIFPNNRKNEKE